MEIIVKKKINGSVLEFKANERDFKESILKLGHLLEEDYCWLDEFKSNDIKWKVKKALSKKDNKWYTYVERVCRNTEGKMAKSTLGQYADNSGYFWKKWELYDPNEFKKGEVEEERQGTPIDEINPSDIPF